MKKLTALLFIASLTGTVASADTIIAPDYSGTSTPPNFTATTSNGGTLTFPGDGTQVSADFSVPNATAYITGTDNTPNSQSYTVQGTFTPSYNAISPGSDYNDVTILGLYTTGGGDPIFSLQLAFNSFVNTASIQVESGVEYSAATTGDGTYTTNTLNGLNNTYSFTDTVTFTVDTPNDSVATIYNNGYLYQAGDSTPIYTFDTVTTGTTVNGDSFEPATNPLSLSVGIMNPGVDSTFFAAGANLTYSNFSVSTTPEPSTIALLFGGLGLLAWVIRRRVAA